MDDFTATMIALGECEKAGINEKELTKEQVTKAWQYLIDTGPVSYKHLTLPTINSE